MNWLWPRDDGASMKPALASMPPLPPATRSSTIVAPISIALSAIRDAVDRTAPRNFNGNADNPAPQLIQNAVINWTMTRGPIAANGGGNALSISTQLSGQVHAMGALSQTAGNAVNGLVTNLLGDAGKKLGNAGIGINIKNLDANADIRGTVAVTSRPTLQANWRVEPNMAGQVNLGASGSGNGDHQRRLGYGLCRSRRLADARQARRPDPRADNRPQHGAAR